MGRDLALGLAVLSSVALLVACGGPDEQGSASGEGTPEETRTATEREATGTPVYDPGELVGTSWVLASLDGGDLVEGTRIAARFRPDSLRGNAGCNFYSTDRVTVDDGSVRIGPAETTQIGCKGAVGEQESAYLDALQDADTYRAGEGRLEIRNSAGETTLVFEKEER